MKSYFLPILFMGLTIACQPPKGNGSSTPAPTEKTSEKAPQRAPYEGFEWRKVTGGGLTFWAQHSKNITVLADAEGAVMVRNNDARPHRLMQWIKMEGAGPDALLKALARQPGWDARQTACLEKTDAGRPGVERYVLKPDGEYAKRIQDSMSHYPIPITCSGWGVGNSGMRYFELFDSAPGKALFVEIGQDAPLFDESSITATTATDDKHTTLQTLQGTLRIGHEVRSFTPDGSSTEYWVADRTGGQLETQYDRLTGGKKNGKSVRATLKVTDDGKWDDGFAAEYESVLLVYEVVEINGQRSAKQ